MEVENNLKSVNVLYLHILYLVNAGSPLSFDHEDLNAQEPIIIMPQSNVNIVIVTCNLLKILKFSK